MTPLTRPCCANNMDQSSDTTTHEQTTGKKKAVRNRVRKGKCSFIASAMSSGRVDSPSTTKKAKKNVLRSAVWNSASLNNWIKLPAPTNVGVRVSVASKKLR